ncbi:GNAT family N-acetyltransferase [Cellulomonas sp. Marseille-Q8402]
MTTYTVTDLPADDRFEIRDAEGTVLGVASYRRAPGVVVFTHTEVDPRHEGHGVGTTLVREALDTVRAAGMRIEPQCPFVRDFVAEHAEYADLVADPAR